MSKTGFSLPLRRGEAPVLRAFVSPAVVRDPPSILPQVSSPFAHACGAGVHQSSRIGRHRRCRRRKPAERRPMAAASDGQGWPCFSPSAQSLHQHLLGAAHHPASSAASPRASGSRSPCPSRRHPSLLVIASAMRGIQWNGLLRRSAPRNDGDGADRTPQASSCSIISGSPCSPCRARCSRPSGSQTFVTFVFFAVVTGVGGGTLRDLLIGAPVFWVHTNATLAHLHRRGAARTGSISRRSLRRPCACCGSTPPGLAAYATYGAAKALSLRRRAGSRLRQWAC